MEVTLPDNSDSIYKEKNKHISAPAHEIQIIKTGNILNTDFLITVIGKNRICRETNRFALVVKFT